MGLTRITSDGITDATIATADLADSAVSTAKIANGAVSNAKIVDGAINNAKVVSDAAIAGTKISPDFGSQNIVTTGFITSNDITIQDTSPRLQFTDTNNDDDFSIVVESGLFKIRDTTNDEDRLFIHSDGEVDLWGHVDIGAGLDVTGNITVTGTVDGVDIAALSTTVSNITTDVVSDTSPQLGGNLDVNTKNITFGDSGSASDDRLTFGAGTDMSLYHDGNNSVIENATGDLYIQNEAGNTSNQIFIRGKESTNSIVVHGNGAVELYDQSSGSASKKFETTSGGVSVTGTVTSSSHIISGGMVDISDNNQLRLGNSQDMMISHDGSSSGSIRNQTGELYLRSDGIRLVNNGNDETYIKCVDDGGVELYHNNSKKLSSTQYGIEVHGSTDSARIDFLDAYSNSRIGYFGLNRFGIDAHDGMQIRDPSDSYAVRFTLDSNGSVIIGGSSLNNSSVSGQALQVSGTTRPTLILRGNSSGSNVAEIQFADNSGSDSDSGTQAGLIRYDHHGGNIMSFHRNETEGFRMGASENIFIHSQNSSGSNGRIYTNKANANTTTLEVNQNGGSGTEMITFRNSGTQLGTIHQSGSGVSYQSQSDYRLKENDVVISDGITRLKQLRPIRFNWKVDTKTVVDGFYAHEVSAVVPEAVRGNKDEIFDTDGVGTQKKGDPKYQQLEQSKLIPLLTAALQEEIAKRETLEARVAALEAS